MITRDTAPQKITPDSSSAHLGVTVFCRGPCDGAQLWCRQGGQPVGPEPQGGILHVEHLIHQLQGRAGRESMRCGTGRAGRQGYVAAHARCLLQGTDLQQQVGRQLKKEKRQPHWWCMLVIG